VEKNKNNFLDKKLVFKILNQLKFRNNIRLDIMGGEPLLHDELFDIIAYAKKLKNVKKIQLYTNGTLITRKIAKKIKMLGVDNAIVSLFSYNQEEYDLNAGVYGAWQRAVNGINNLVAAGIKTYSLVVVNSKNVDYLDNFEKFAHLLKIRTIYFPYIQQRINDDLCIADKVKYQNSINWMVNKSNKYKDKIIRFMNHHMTVCNAFPRSLTITTNGEVKPCPFARMSLGNIYSQNIQSIVTKACFNKELTAFLTVPDDCRACSIVNRCGGGCKALNYNHTYYSIINTTNRCSGPYSEAIDDNDLGEYLPFFE